MRFFLLYVQKKGNWLLLIDFSSNHKITKSVILVSYQQIKLSNLNFYSFNSCQLQLNRLRLNSFLSGFKLPAPSAKTYLPQTKDARLQRLTVMKLGFSSYLAEKLPLVSHLLINGPNIAQSFKTSSVIVTQERTFCRVQIFFFQIDLAYVFQNIFAMLQKLCINKWRALNISGRAPLSAFEFCARSILCMYLLVSKSIRRLHIC